LATLSVILTILASLFQHVEGKLLVLAGDDEQTQVGWTTGALFKLRDALETGIGVFDVLDYDSGESYAYACQSFQRQPAEADREKRASAFVATGRFVANRTRRSSPTPSWSRRRPAVDASMV
jgi:hypothetical protein